MRTFFPAITPSGRNQPLLWFVFSQEQLLVYKTATGIELPNWTHFAQSGLTAIRQHYLGCLETIYCCYAVEIVPTSLLTHEMIFLPLRALFNDLSAELFALAGRALQIISWDKNHQFCSRCGTKMIADAKERVKRCPSCKWANYPPLAPAVIMLISRGRELLLSRGWHFQPGMYSVQAGFVEAGETLEEAVRREICEEVGLEIKNIRYFGSQPWPFPNSLMVGFLAEYASGELCVNHQELEDANWYKINQLPKLPTGISIARQMIERFLMMNDDLICNRV
jgi:NAD+ diphosphatase